MTTLPHVDEHARTIPARVDVVWDALLEALDRVFARPVAPRYARLVGCRDTDASGPRPLSVGSSIPGFHVVTARPDAELVLEGAHRFSSYALVFRLEELAPDRTRLCAETRASFPGITGALYRLAVIGTRGHVLAVRRLLSAVQRTATN
jgi:hypothetical protein